MYMYIRVYVCTCSTYVCMYVCMYVCVLDHLMSVCVYTSLVQEFQLPAFSSSLLVRPPRGDNQYLDIRLNYPFLCLSVDAVLQVRESPSAL